MEHRSIRTGTTASISLTYDRALRGAVDTWLGLDTDSTSDVPHVGALTIRRGRAHRPRGEPWLEMPVVSLWRRPDEVAIETALGAVGSVDLAAGTGTIDVAGTDATSHWEALHRAARSLSFLLLARADHHIIHASSVAHGDRSLLIVGASGAGKTTLALRLALDGLDLLADDSTLVHGPRLTASGLGERPRVVPGGPIGASGGRPLADGKVGLGWTPDPGRSAQLGGVLFLDDEASAEPALITPGNALERLLATWFVTLDPVADRTRMQMVAAIASTVPCRIARSRPEGVTVDVVRGWLAEPARRLDTVD